MRITRALVTAVTVAIGTTCTAPSVNAQEEVAINGTFIAFSDGQWAQTKMSYHDEASITQTWTITSTCATFMDCTGTVVSDRGWTGDLKYSSGMWRARHTVQNWERCADGTTAPGEQTFTFHLKYPPDGTFVGRDRTVGPSGACGINDWLTIEMPFTLTPVG
jgi:hypothetical protein